MVQLIHCVSAPLDVMSPWPGYRLVKIAQGAVFCEVSDSAGSIMMFVAYTPYVPPAHHGVMLLSLTESCHPQPATLCITRV